MNKDTVGRLRKLETTRDALKSSREYLREHLRALIHSGERALICFPDTGEDSVGALMARVVRDCGAEPVFWGPDFRWKTLLRLAFDSRAITVVGPPLVVFGMMKLARVTATPLFIGNAVIGGYPFSSWIVNSIKKGLDCRIRGCYLIDDGPVVAGVTCAQEAGIHIRDELFEASIRDRDGKQMADAQRGHLTLRYRPLDDIVFDAEETAKIWHQPCTCGCDDPRIVETLYVGGQDADKSILEDGFLDWSSVLDYRVTEREDGKHLELVVFPGQVLPKISYHVTVSARCWDPETDEPFCMEKYKNNAEYH